MINIRPFVSGDEPGVADVIVPIQREEFGIAITLAQQPDLGQIPDFYQRGLGNFWVAEADGQIVGTVGLVDIGEQHVALRKMFVRAAYRGREHGVAQRLLDTALAWCAANGVADVNLGTTAQFLAAHRFYERNGFVQVAPEQLPASFPRMAVDTRFYRLSIVRQPSSLHSALIHPVERILPETWADWRDGLSSVLIDCVDAGASISFLPPLDRATADAFWDEVAAGLRAGQIVLFGVRDAHGVAGTAHLTLSWKPNSAHRAEVNKVLVHTRARRRGIAQALMLALEAEARARGLRLLILDTRADSEAEPLYRSLGYVEAGRIPDFALSPQGMDTAVFFYKQLT